MSASDRPLDIFTFGIHGSRPAESRLGLYGYSWDLALRNFLPVLERIGAVHVVQSPENQLQDRVRQSLATGRQPLILAFRPFQNTHPVSDAPVINYCFWEFPDVPAEAINGDPRTDWKKMSGQVDMVLCASTATADAFRRAGVQTPLCVVPPPLPSGWFETLPDGEVLADVPALELTPGLAPPAQSDSAPAKRNKSMRSVAQRWVPPVFFDLIVHTRQRLRARSVYIPPGAKPCAVGNDGVVFTFVFNPDDSRKAWQDLLSAFFICLRDKPDATLVFKLVAQPDHLRHWLIMIAARLRALDAHQARCRFLAATDRLSEEQMRRLMRCSSWYVNATRAEGCCLPLLEAMASGRPGISPVHTAMKDYMAADAGLVFQSAAEPCIMPGDASGRLLTTWQHLCWPSLSEQLTRAYEIAKFQPEHYQALASKARAAAMVWASEEVVLRRLREAIARLRAARPNAFSEAA